MCLKCDNWRNKSICCSLFDRYKTLKSFIWSFHEISLWLLDLNSRKWEYQANANRKKLLRNTTCCCIRFYAGAKMEREYWWDTNVKLGRTTSKKSWRTFTSIWILLKCWTVKSYITNVEVIHLSAEIFRETIDMVLPHHTNSQQTTTIG